MFMANLAGSDWSAARRALSNPGWPPRPRPLSLSLRNFVAVQSNP